MAPRFNYDVREFQEHILGLLDVIDDVCRKHGLKLEARQATLPFTFIV